MKQGSESSPPASPPIPDKPALPPRKKTLAKQSAVGTIPASSPQIGRSSRLSPRRSSIVQPRNSKSHSESISPIEQVKQHRQPLIDKLKSLPKTPAPFAAAVARIKETLVLFEESKDKSIVILKDEISRIIEPVDLFDDEKRTAICEVTDLRQGHPTLDHLNGIIEHLTKIKTDLEVLYLTIASELDPIIKGYEEFRTKLLNSANHDRASIFSPAANVVGECVDFGLLDQETALQLHCCDRYKKKVKANEHGMHAVAQYDGIFYKPNVSAFEVLDTFDLFIQPGMEYAIFALLQLFAGEHCVAAPTSWIKVSHVQKYTSREKRDGYMEKVIQTGLGITGISLQHLLILISRMQKFTNQVYRPDAIRAIRALQGREKKLQELLERFPIIAKFLSEEREFQGVKNREKKNIEKLINLDICNKIISLLQEILSTFDSEQKDYLLHKDPRGFGTLLNDSNKDQVVFNRQNFVVSLLASHSFTDVFSGVAILPDCIEAVTQFYIDGLISLFPYVKYFKILFPNGTPEELIDAIPNFLSRLDMAHFSATFIGHLMARPSDAKADNFQVRLIRDAISQAVVSFQIIGIDNDRALSYPITIEKKEESEELGYRIGVKCIFFLFKIALQQPVAWAIRERILFQLPIFWALNWAALLYEHSQETQTRIEQNVLLRSDQEEMVGGKDNLQVRKVLDIPIKLAASTFPQLYKDILEVSTVLEKNIKATHQDLLKRLHPILFAFYDNCINENPDILVAYDRVHNRPSLDEKFSGFDCSQYNKDHDAYVTERTLSVSEAITQFTDQFEWSTLSSTVQTQVLDFCAQHFPKLKLFTKCSLEWLNKKLIESVYQGKSGVVKLLIRARANVAICDDADRTLLHILFSRIDRLTDESVLSTLTALLKCPTLPLNRVDAVGFSPLMILVNYFSPGKVDLARDAIELLKNRGIKLDQTDPEKGETALDRVIERDLPDLFILLIKNGAGKHVNVVRANDFLQRYFKADEYIAAMHEAHDVLMQTNSEFAYRFTLSAMCSHEPQKECMLIEGAECGSIYLLSECISQVFNEAGEFHEKHSDQMGRRKVAPVYTAKDGKKLQMHLKENPELPGNELAVGTFRRRLYGHGAPFTEVFKFINPKGFAYPVIFSKSIKGRNFHAVLKDPQQSVEVLGNLDHRSVCEMIVSSILINPEDEKPDNIIVEAIQTARGRKYCLPCVDNDHGFVSPLTKDAANRTVLQIKTIYYCLKEMNEPLHPDVIAEFLELDPEQLLREWLTDLASQEDRYQQLFTSDEKKRLLTKGSARGLVRDIKEAEFKGVVKRVHGHFKNPQTPSVVPIPIRPELVIELYNKILAIQRAFKKNPYITGMQLLVDVIPEIGVFYEESFKAHNTPLERFDALTGPLYSKAIAGRYGTLANSHQILRSLNIPEEFITNKELQAQFGPKQALSILKLIHSQSKELDEILTDLYEGNFKRFRNLKFPKHKETIVNKIDWKLVIAKEKTIENLSEKILQVISKESYTRLKLAYCTGLNSIHLTKFLKNSPGLTRLDLSYCPMVSIATVQLLEKQASNLEVLNLQGTLITEFTSTNFLKLRRAMLQDCLNLTDIRVSGPRAAPHPTLTMLSIDRSINIKELDVNSNAVKEITHEDVDVELIYKAVKRAILILNAGEKKYANKEFLGAIADFDEAIRLNPKLATAHFFRGLCNISLNQYEIAINDFNKALRLKYSKSKTLNNLGYCKYELKRYKEALQDYEEAFHCDPSDVTCICNLAKTHQSLHRYEDALEYYGKAIIIDPSNSILYTVRGELLEKLCRYEEALKDRDESIRLGPSQHHYSQRGILRAKLDFHEDAITDFNEAFRLSLDGRIPSTLSLIRRSRSEICLGNYREAMKTIIKVCEVSGQTEKNVINIQGVIHYYLKDYELALGFFNDLLKENQHEEALNNRGLTKYALGDFHDAIDDFNDAIHLDPDNLEAIVNRVRVKYYLGMINGLEKEISEVIEKNPFCLEAYYYRGLCKFERGYFSDALQDFSESIRINATITETYLYTGKIFYTRQALEDAYKRNHYYTLDTIRVKLNIYDVFIARGRAYLMSGDIDKASEDINYAIKCDPKNPEGYFNRAILNIFCQNFTKAFDDTNTASYHQCDSINSYLLLSYLAFSTIAMNDHSKLNLLMSSIHSPKTLLVTDSVKMNPTYLKATYIIIIIEALIKFSENDLESGDQLLDHLDKAISPEYKNLRFELLVLSGLGLRCIQFRDKIKYDDLSLLTAEQMEVLLDSVDLERIQYPTRALAALRKAITISPGFENVIMPAMVELESNIKIGIKAREEFIRDMGDGQVEIETLMDFVILDNKINSQIMAYLPMRDCVRLSRSSCGIWNKSKGILLLRALKDVVARRSIDNLAYLADVLDSSPIFRTCNPNHLRLAGVLAKAEHHLDSLVKRSQYADWLILGMCGFELRKVNYLLRDIKHNPEFAAIQTSLLIGLVLGGHVDIINEFIGRIEPLNLELLSKLLEFSLLGGNISVFQFLRTRYDDLFIQLFCGNNLDTVIEKFFEFALRGGDEETVEALIAEYSNVFDVSRLNSLALFLGQWKFYKRYQTHGAFDAVVIVDRDDLSHGDNYERRVMVASSATFTGNLGMLISVSDDVRHVHPKLAIECGYADIFWYFVDNQFLSLTDTFDNGDTVLHILARNGHLTLLREVINKDNFVMVYFVTDKNQTLLHAAAEGGHRNVYDYLMKHFYGNKPIPVDSDGNTPEVLANKLGYGWFVKCLEQNRAVQAVEPAAPKKQRDDSDEDKTNVSMLIY